MFSVSICVQLRIPIEDKKLRKKLQTQAAKEGWTARQLEEQIQSNYESKLTGRGRQWNLPASKQQALRQISQRSQQWLRWYAGLESAEDISVSDLPEAIQKRLKAAVREIRKLEEATMDAD